MGLGIAMPTLPHRDQKPLITTRQAWVDHPLYPGGERDPALLSVVPEENHKAVLRRRARLGHGVEPITLITAGAAKTCALQCDGPGPHLDNPGPRATGVAGARVRRVVKIVLAQGVHHEENDVVGDSPVSYVLPGDVCLKWRQHWGQEVPAQANPH